MSQRNVPDYIPEQFESERVLIRCPRPELDAANLNAAIESSIQELREWMPWAHTLYDLEQQIDSLQKARQAYLQHTDFRLLLFSKESGDLVGSSGIHRFDWDAGKFEIGYWVVTSHSGKGYIREAVSRITQFCIEQFQANRIEIRCDARNNKSAAVAKRLGFKLEGRLRKEQRDHTGELRDTLVFAKVRGEEF